MVFKSLPAISFQSFEIRSLENICHLALTILLAICFQNFPAICFKKSFKNFQAIAFKTLKANRWEKCQLHFKFLKAILSRENQDGRHQGNHRPNAAD